MFAYSKSEPDIKSWVKKNVERAEFIKQRLKQVQNEPHKTENITHIRVAQDLSLLSRVLCSICLSPSLHRVRVVIAGLGRVGPSQGISKHSPILRGLGGARAGLGISGSSLTI